MKKTYVTLLFIVLAISLFPQESRAQFVFGIKGGLTTLAGLDGCLAGGAVTVGKQMKMTSLQADFGYCPAAANVDLSCLLRIYGNKDHSTDVYLGAGLTAEIRLHDAGKNELMAGAFPVLQAEQFISKRISLYADVRTPCMYFMDEDRMSARFAAGIRCLLYKEEKR